MNKENLIFEKPEKPEIENLVEIKMDCNNFENPEKAEALIKSIGLNSSDEIREDDGERFTINPRMVLRGKAPEVYEKQIEKVKVILTEKEKESISLYYKKKKEHSKIRDKIYYGITRRVQKLYNWDDENKKHIPKKNSKRSIEICEALDWIYHSEQYHGFSNMIYHILSKEESTWVYCYRQAWFNKPVPNIQEWREENDGEYWVLTESEADYQAKEYLTDDTYFWQQQIEAGYTTESLDDWAETVIEIDGRGNQLAGYDCVENMEKINDTWYCIYRTN